MYLNNQFPNGCETFRQCALAGGCGRVWVSIEVNPHFALSISPILPLFIDVSCLLLHPLYHNEQNPMKLWPRYILLLFNGWQQLFCFILLRKVMNTNDLYCIWKWWLNRPPGTLPCSSLLLYVSQLTPHYDVFSTDENHQANSDLRFFPLAVHFCPEFSSSRCLHSSLLAFRPQLKCQTLQWSSYSNLIGNNSLITFYHAPLSLLLGSLLALLLCLNNLIDHDPY